MNQRHLYGRNILICMILSLLALISCGQQEDVFLYKNPNLPVEERVEDLLKQMTLDEKIEQLSGLGFDTRENTRLGIPPLRMADGPVGVRRGKATAFPAAPGTPQPGRSDKSLNSPYPEDIFVGYRYLDKHHIQPLFPFGHGLSYTRFEYSNLSINPSPTVGEEGFPVIVSVDIRNIGKQKGTEVVQVYVKDMECRVKRPGKELKGFEKVSLEPGEKKTISIKLNQRAFAFYDTVQNQWVVEPGEFEIMTGGSSKDIRLKGHIILPNP